MAAIGLIKGVSARFDRKEIVIFPDRMVLVSSGDMMGRVLAQQFGLLGMAVYGLTSGSRKRAAAERLQKSPAELTATDPKATEILLGDVVDARLSSGFLTAKLVLSMADGSTKKFTWAKGENRLADIVGYLQAALGTKLIQRAA